MEEAQEALRRSPGHPFAAVEPRDRVSRAGPVRRSAKKIGERSGRAAASRRRRRGGCSISSGMLLGDGSAAAHLAWAKDRPREFDLVSAQAQVAAYEGRLREARRALSPGDRHGGGARSCDGTGLGLRRAARLDRGAAIGEPARPPPAFAAHWRWSTDGDRTGPARSRGSAPPAALAMVGSRRGSAAAGDARRDRAIPRRRSSAPCSRRSRVPRSRCAQQQARRRDRGARSRRADGARNRRRARAAVSCAPRR